MAVLAWGKCTLEMITSENGAPKGTGSWTKLPTPKQGTTQLETTEGDATEALEEGGDMVDRYVGASKSTLTFQLFQKKGEVLPIEYHDGKVAGEWAFRIIPEDEECVGRQLDRCRVSVSDTFTTADGFLLTVTCTVLKPATGDMVKTYTKTKA